MKISERRGRSVCVCMLGDSINYFVYCCNKKKSSNKQLRALRVYCGSQCERIGVSRQQESEAAVTLHLQPGSMSSTFEILFGNSAHEMVLPTLRNCLLPQLIRSG